MRIRMLHFSLGIVAASGCAEGRDAGGITARIVFERSLSGAHRALRAQSVPTGIARLQILAEDASGMTLAETNLMASPRPGEAELDPNGGAWRLERVPVGKDRRVIGRAYLGPSADPRTNGLLLFEGRLDGIEVRSGEVVQAGVLTLRMIEGVRYPPLDQDPPDPPSPMIAAEVPEGEALAVTFARPLQADLAGYLVAVGQIADARTPTIARGAAIQEGSSLGSGFAITHALRSPTPQSVTVGGLENGRAYKVLVYAFDADLDGRALNYSTAAQAFAIPRDSLPPNAPRDLAIGEIAPERVQITFTAPGEDGELGTPLEYELRTSSVRGDLENPMSFQAAAPIAPPPVQPPGQTVTFERSYDELRFQRAGQFFVGLRARDTGGLPGAIAVATFTRSSTVSPQIDALSPEIALAGGEIMIRGRGFGDAPGTVALTTTSTPSQRTTLSLSRWSDSEIVAIVPPLAESGLLSVTSNSGASVRTFLSVILRLDGIVPSYAYPFELVAAARSVDPVVGALYREIEAGGVFEGGIERFLGLVAENDPLAELNALERSTAIAGTYVPARDRFIFVASNAPLSMTIAVVSSSTAAYETRIATAVAAGGADRVSIVPLDGGAGASIPAMIAFSRDGTVRTATVADVRSQPFNLFTTYSSTVAQLDRVTIARRTTSGMVMAYRAVGAGGAELVVLTNATTDPGAFAVRPVLSKPRSGPNFEIVAIPIGGSAEEFVIAYEEIDVSGPTDIRIIRLADYGQKKGYAPFPFTSGAGRRLEDVGLVAREGEVWLALLASQLGTGAELRYTEVPLGALGLPDARRGEHPGVALDSAPDTSRARLGCRLAPLRACPMVWLGEDANVLFVRR